MGSPRERRTAEDRNRYAAALRVHARREEAAERADPHITIAERAELWRVVLAEHGLAPNGTRNRGIPNVIAPATPAVRRTPPVEPTVAEREAAWWAAEDRRRAENLAYGQAVIARRSTSSTRSRAAKPKPTAGRPVLRIKPS